MPDTRDLRHKTDEELAAEAAAREANRPSPYATNQGADSPDADVIYSEAELTHIKADFEEALECVSKAHAHFPDTSTDTHSEPLVYTSDLRDEIKANIQRSRECLDKVERQIQ